MCSKKSNFGHVYDLINKKILEIIKKEKTNIIKVNEDTINKIILDLLKSNILTIKDVNKFYKYVKKDYAISKSIIDIFLADYNFINNKFYAYLEKIFEDELSKSDLFVYLKTYFKKFGNKIYYKTNNIELVYKEIANTINHDKVISSLLNEKTAYYKTFLEFQQYTKKMVMERYLTFHHVQIFALQKIFQYIIEEEKCNQLEKHIINNLSDSRVKHLENYEEKHIINNLSDINDTLSQKEEINLIAQKIIRTEYCLENLSDLNIISQSEQEVFAINKNDNFMIPCSTTNKNHKKYYFNKLIIIYNPDLYHSYYLGWVSNYTVKDNNREIKVIGLYQDIFEAKKIMQAIQSY